MAQQATKRQRRGIACSQQESKGSLRRFVRDAEGAVSFDPTGRAAGRGAYVCSMECFQDARKGRRLERALRVKLTEDDYDRLAAELARAVDGSTLENEE